MRGLQTIGQHCPYCGELIELVIDCSVSEQDYIEDCEVCCRPIRISVRIDEDEAIEVWLASEDQ